MRLYLDTNVISMWYDPKAHNRAKRKATRRLLLLCMRGFHHGYVTEVVRTEIRASKEPYRTRDLRLILQLMLREPVYDEEAAFRLFEAYEKEGSLAKLPQSDLRHLAVFSASDLEAIVTYDLKHFANQVRLDVVRKINDAQGIRKELRVGPPEVFLPPTRAL